MLKKKEQERVQLAVVPACSRTSHVPFLPKSTLLFSVKKKSTPVAPPWLSVVQWLWWIGLGVVPERLSQPRPNGLDSSHCHTVNTGSNSSKDRSSKRKASLNGFKLMIVFMHS